MIGIYKITSPTNKIYIGQSLSIDKRFKDYKRILNSKGQIRLHRSFLKHGIHNHKFEAICECEISELNDRERYFQDLYSAISKNGLNCKLTKSTDKSGVLSIETKNKMSKKRNTAEHFKKTILDNQTGIFYLGVKEAANVYNLNAGTLSQRLSGKLPNNTNLIYL